MFILLGEKAFYFQMPQGAAVLLPRTVACIGFIVSVPLREGILKVEALLENSRQGLSGSSKHPLEVLLLLGFAHNGQAVSGLHRTAPHSETRSSGASGCLASGFSLLH